MALIILGGITLAAVPEYEQIKAMRDLAQSENAKMIIMGKGSSPVIPDTK